MTYEHVVVTLAVAIPLAGMVTELLLRKLRLRGYGHIAGHWLQGQGQEAKGSIRGGFAVSDREDSAYVLRHISASPGDMSRLVVFLKGEVRYDANMPIAAAARIPKDKIASIEWRDRRPPGRPDGDGILVIQKYQDPSSAMILSPAGYSSSPPGQRNFHTISLQ